MRARGFNKRIEVWETVPFTTVGGGSGGSPVKLVETWASIKTIKGSKPYTDLGLDFTRVNLEIKLRKRPDINYNSTTMFLKHKDIKYSIQVAPTNEDLSGAYITFVATEIKPKQVALSPIYKNPAYLYAARVERAKGELENRECTINYGAKYE